MVGGNYYTTDRYIRYNAPNHPTARLNRTAHSHSSGIQWTNHLGLIGDLSPLSVPLQIFGNLDHFYLHNGSFNESGANSLNMRVNSKTSNALRSELGLSSSYTFKVEGGCWTPYARISWVNKTLLSSSSYRGGFRGQTGTFSVSASSKGSNQWAPGVGVEFANVHGFSILMNTRAELSGKMKNYSADMRMDYTF
jgi:outer membrane autotransporter protein